MRTFLPPGGAIAASSWRPLVDVYRTRAGWLVKFEMAGVRSEDFTLTVQGSRLTVTGTRRDCSIEEGCCHYLLEIAYSQFERSIELPENIERAEIATESHHGM